MYLFLFSSMLYLFGVELLSPIVNEYYTIFSVVQKFSKSTPKKSNLNFKNTYFIDYLNKV